MVRCIRHDFGSDDWQAVAIILVKGYNEVRYFPNKMNKAFMIASIFGEESIKPDILLNSFFQFLPCGDRSLLENAILKTSLDLTNYDDDTLEVLSSLKSKRIVHDCQ